MFCSNCGNKMNDDSVFCSECGCRKGQVVQVEQKPLALTLYEKYPDNIALAMNEMQDMTGCKAEQARKALNVYYNIQPQPFYGVYRYQFGMKIPAACPRCGSGDCQYHYSDRMRKSNATYSINLSPLRPFTHTNKRERYNYKIQKNIICNRCGKIFT